MLCSLPFFDPVPSLYPAWPVAAARSRRSSCVCGLSWPAPEVNWPQVLHPTTEHHLISTGREDFSCSAVPFPSAGKSHCGPQASVNPFLCVNRWMRTRKVTSAFRGYTGSRVTASRSRFNKVALSSRKSHLTQRRTRLHELWNRSNAWNGVSGLLLARYDNAGPMNPRRDPSDRRAGCP